MVQSSKWSSLLFCAVFFQLQLTLSQGGFSCRLDSPVMANVLSAPVGPQQVSVDLTYTFCGQINVRTILGTVANGFHARPSNHNPPCANLTYAQWMKLPQDDTDYSVVEYPAIYNGNSSTSPWVIKNGISSFFPARLSYDELISMIADMVNSCTEYVTLEYLVPYFCF